MVSLSSVTSRLVLWMSTTGVSPVTVMVSSTPPTRKSASTVMTPVPPTARPSRFTVLKPGSVNVTRIGPREGDPRCGSARCCR